MNHLIILQTISSSLFHMIDISHKRDFENEKMLRSPIGWDQERKRCQDLGRLLWQFKSQIGIVFHQNKNTNINYSIRSQYFL